MKKFFLLFFIFILSFNSFCQTSNNVEFQAGTPINIEQGRVFPITYSSTQKIENISTPDFKDLHFYRGPIDSVLYYTNGKPFLYFYQYFVYAPSKGVYTIPSATATIGGKTYVSDEKTIYVTENKTIGNDVIFYLNINNNQTEFKKNEVMMLTLYANKKPSKIELGKLNGVKLPKSELKEQKEIYIINGKEHTAYSYSILAIAQTYGKHIIEECTATINGKKYYTKPIEISISNYANKQTTAQYKTDITQKSIMGHQTKEEKDKILSELNNNVHFYIACPSQARAFQKFEVMYRIDTIEPDKFIKPQIKNLQKTKTEAQYNYIESTGITNGKKYSSIVYHFQYILYATDTGKYTIPAAEIIINNKKFKCESKEIEILPRIDIEKVSHSVEIKPQKPEVGRNFNIIITFNLQPDEKPQIDYDNLSEISVSSEFSQINDTTKYIYTYTVQANNTKKNIIKVQTSFGGKPYNIEPIIIKATNNIKIRNRKIGVLCAIAAILFFLIIITYKKVKNKNRHTKRVRNEFARKPATEKPNDKIIIIDHSVNEEHLDLILTHFCNYLNRKQYNAILKLTKIDKYYIITFPYDINYYISLYLIVYLESPNEVDDSIKSYGWLSVPDGRNLETKQNVKVFAHISNIKISNNKDVNILCFTTIDNETYEYIGDEIYKSEIEEKYSECPIKYEDIKNLQGKIFD